MSRPEADPFAAPIKAAAGPAMALSSQPKEVAEDVQRQAQLRRVDKDIEHLMRARYPLIYILSSEEKRVEKSIADVLQSREREALQDQDLYLERHRGRAAGERAAGRLEGPAQGAAVR